MERIFCKIKRMKRKLEGKRITAKVMSAVFIASSMLNAFAPVAAYAAEPELATVSLSETQHGKLSFDDTEDMTLAVEVGTDVTVNVTPDEGYFSDGITVFKGEEDGTAVDVKDGKATFTVEGDTIVTSTFYENGTVGSAAFKSVDVDEGEAVTSVENYIRDHADAQYVGEGDELTRADVLTVTTTVVDGNKLPKGTLDALWADDDGDGMSDHWEAMLSQATSHAVLFEIDPDANYYVGWAGADIANSKLTDWGASENNADAKMREGFIVDEATGLVYVPKSYTELNDEGEPMVASSRIQLVYTVENESAEAAFDFNSTATDVRGDVAGKGKVAFPVTAASTKVTLATDDEALEALNGRTIDSVTVNGIEYTPDMGMWEYDAETGSLEYAMAPAGIHAMNVKMSDNFGKGVASFFRMPEPRMSVNNIGTWEFKSAPWAGQTFITQGRNAYTGHKVPGYILPAVENPGGGNYETKTVNQAMGWQHVDLSKLQAGNYSIMRTADIWAQDTGAVKIPTETHLALTCGHVGVDNNFNYNPGYNEAAAMENKLGQHIRVFSVSGNEAIIGVTVPTSHTQAGAGFFKINWRVSAGHINLHKVSANPSITDGNNCYSLEGAEFTVLNASGQSMGVLRTNANGDTNTLELPEGTYAVRETKPPKGYLPAPDQQVTVHGGQTTTVEVADNPALDPVTVVVGKFDGEKEYNANNLPQGSASLEGAEFTIEYFDTLDYDNYDVLKKDGVNPTRSWVVRTNKKGYANLSKQFLVSGDEFYLDPTGVPTLPRGSVAVYESKAPTGYKLRSDVNFQKIQENPTVGTPTFNLPEVPELVIRGGVKIIKRDIENGISEPIGAASIDGTQFEVKSLNENPVIADGVTYNKGQVITTLTIKNGEASTTNDLLPFGLYSIQEVKPGEGYLLTDGKAHEFRIEKDGELVNPVNGPFENQVMRSDLEFTKKGDDGSDRLAGIAFKVTSKTTGESHVAVTDENGFFSSAASWNKHTQNTNGNDRALDADGVIDSDELDATAGIWFGGTEPDDSKGALPYDTYDIAELRCTANEGYQLIKTSVIVSRDGKVYDFGTLTDVKASITTKAYDPMDSDSNIGMSNHAKIEDKVTYVNLFSGRDYKLVAELHDSASGDALTGTDGQPITAEHRFTAHEPSGFEVVTFDGVDTLGLSSKTITVYEKLYDDDGSLIAKHTDKDDVNQQVTVVSPEISTTAADGVDGDKEVIADGEVMVIDTVAYKGLIPGETYTLKGTLHIKKTADDGKVTGEPLEVGGKHVTAEATFVPDKSDGKVDVTFTFASAGISQDTELVAFESLEKDGVELAAHTDIEDENQTTTVHVPRISTTATDSLDGDKNVIADAETAIIDEVAYEHVLTGIGYTMTGILMDAGTGLPILTGDGSEKYTDADVKTFMQRLLDACGLSAKDDGKGVSDKALNYSSTAALPVSINTDALGKLIADKEDLISHLVYQTVEFTPEKYNGTVTMAFRFNAADVIDRFGGETKNIVVFEVMSKNAADGEEGSAPVIVASECALDSDKQTVNLVACAIGTTATDKSDGDHTLMAGKDAVITDRVTYKGLIPGKEYTLKATLMDKKTGEKLSINDQHVTADLKFTPNSQSGFIDIDLGKFDASSLDGHNLVVYEELYKQTEKDGEPTEVLVAKHKDINDKGQTVTVTAAPPGGFFGKTGGDDFLIVFSITTLVILACGCAYYGIKNLRTAKSEDAVVDDGNDSKDGNVSGKAEA